MTPAPVGLRCPEHSGKPQGIHKVTAAAERAVTGVGGRRINAVTTALITINVAVYVLELVSGGTINGLQNTIEAHGALVANGYLQGEPVGLLHGDWWRLITSGFLHYGPMHLGLNMFSLYYAGSFLESAIGRWRFLLLYIVSILVGSAGALITSPDAISLGASGGIFGVLGGLFVLERRGAISTGGQILGLIVLNLVFTFALSSFISVGAHIGGLIGGVVLMAALVQFRRSWQLSLASAGFVAVVAVFVAYNAI
ncbi:unannotated protein [freshwater metagenome]|uniref:Unannotated protein n=1 Tax=freshwater metagenome TaxID=449393 RepID=A0A6J6PPN1_9ZZZZ